MEQLYLKSSSSRLEKIITCDLDVLDQIKPIIPDTDLIEPKEATKAIAIASLGHQSRNFYCYCLARPRAALFYFYFCLFYYLISIYLFLIYFFMFYYFYYFYLFVFVFFIF